MYNLILCDSGNEIASVSRFNEAKMGQVSRPQCSEIFLHQPFLVSASESTHIGTCIISNTISDILKF